MYVWNILVGGGSGFVGRHLVRCLKNSGAKVRIITRTPKRKEHLSWTDIKTNGLPSDVNAVVNLAGRNILDFRPWTESFKKEVYESRIETNKLLVDAIHEAKIQPKSFVTTSGVGYYPTHQDYEFTEDWAKDAKGRDFGPPNMLMDLAQKWEASGKLDEHKAPLTRHVIIRSGVVLGPDGGIIDNIRIPFSMGFGGNMGSGEQWFPWIHVNDLVNMFKFAITNDHVSGVLNGVSPEQTTYGEFSSEVAKVLKRPRLVDVPEFFIKLAYGSERAVMLLKGQRVKSRAGLLGFRYELSKLADAVENCLTRPAVGEK